MAWDYIITDRPQAHYSNSNNATLIYSILYNEGFTHEAIIGVLANMEHESYINPGQQELYRNGDENYGYGLVQWTPAKSKILKYNRSSWYDGDVQMAYFKINVPASWIPTKAYNISYSQYKEVTDIYTATRAFFYNFERGTYHSALDTYAEYWNNYFGGIEPPAPPPAPEPGATSYIVLLKKRRF